jgi:hypothetical protein
MRAQGFSKEILLEREKWAGYIKARTDGHACLLACAVRLCLSAVALTPRNVTPEPRRSTMGAR